MAKDSGALTVTPVVRTIVARNFRSLVDFALEVGMPYLYIVGSNNVGKSNIVTALKWLFRPRAEGMPSMDLSRTATGLRIELYVQLTRTEAEVRSPSGRSLVGPDALITVGRLFDLPGESSDPQRMEIRAAYAPLTVTLVRSYGDEADEAWEPMTGVEQLFPQLIHIRPADVGRPNDDGSAEAHLAHLRWPTTLTEEDATWVSERLARVFTPQQYPLGAPRLAAAGEDIVYWDEYGNPTPLRRAGTGVMQVAYTLARIALARRQVAQKREGLDRLLVIIDEPEQHLSSHHQKKYADLLIDLAGQHQIIVTSHSGLFVPRGDEGSIAVLVRASNNGTVPLLPHVTTPAAIRETLGITLEDTLTFGEVNLLVEGDSEATALPFMLRRLTEAGKASFSMDHVTIIQRDGASKIPAYAHLVASLGLATVVVVDGDQAGRDAERKMRENPALSGSPILMIPLPEGQRDADFEDLFAVANLIEIANEHLRRRNPTWEVSETDFEDLCRETPYYWKKKWSDRLKGVLQRKGFLQDGGKLEVVLSKSAMIADLIERLDVNEYPEFIAGTVVSSVQEALAERQGMARYTAHPGILAPTHATSASHPVNEYSGIEHDI